MAYLLNLIVSQFGFRSVRDFTCSMIHQNIVGAMLCIATLSAFFETYFGLKVLTVASFVALLTLELVTGIIVSVYIKKQPIRSSRFSRFGFKIFVWMTLFFIVHSFMMQWKGESKLVSALFDWLYNIIFIYVCLEYLVSVLENLGAISGKSNVKLIKGLRRKLDKLLDLDETTNTTTNNEE